MLSCAAISPAAQPFLAALLRHLAPRRSIVVVTDGLRTQDSFQQDIETWLSLKPELSGRSNIIVPTPLFYPAWENLPHEARLPHVDVISERLETLVALSHGQSSGVTQASPMVVTNVVALLQRTFPAAVFRERTRTFTRGHRIAPLDLVEWLEEQGYEPEAQVTQKGELSLRGGILDIYPLTSPWPVRLEFFGDELESLRHFDPLTQASRNEIAAITLPPGGELSILQKGQGTNQREGSETCNPQGLVQDFGTLVDYLPPDTVFLLCDPERLDEQAGEYARQVPAGDRFFSPWTDIKEQAARQGMTLLEASEVEPGSAALGEGVETPRFQSLEAYRPLLEWAPEQQVVETQRREFFAQLHRWLRHGYTVRVFCNNDGERQRFEEIWQELGVVRTDEPDSPQQQVGRTSTLVPRPSIHIGAMARGLVFDEAKLVVVTDAEIFGRYKVQRPRRLKSPHAQAARSALDIDFTDLEEGDYVVHLQHGIGRYLGLKVLPIGAGTKPTVGVGMNVGGGQECLVLEYAAKDLSQPPPKLYVPVTEAHLVGKYVGTGKAHPSLNTLGSGRWARAKAQAELAVRDVASELLAIQAARESQPGHAFAADTPWQREFESAFIFEETPDQEGAILETKKDMERPKPMDRLICGDVGFGKTEVGIRAAFKAVLDGRQVAVLVPTTVLAQQHFNTFRERMADYPVRVELLSRFRSRRAQARVVNDLAAGSVDIVIGTHRLLQDDIAFKELGLVVIDEEQRFGVLHKEKFKMLRRMVDVLTLSATPIPRTLYLALTGARDMSTIQTPPHDRLPVETIIAQYDERLIRDAIQREFNRGGQVFFLHNRVMTIDTVAAKLRTLLPHASIVVGHGQMHSDELEEVMTKFVNGEADVLLCTTIIESGLDIPNANTIIIDRADRFGLSDLYQLRGRVGRYKHQAYAYLLLPRHAGLLTDVRKRLTAIKQYSTLGSGFKIAMRDLEIRGAGNLLGAEQSGHITAVGFELYCQLLKQSVAGLKGEKIKPRVEVQVRLDFLTLTPAEEGRQVSSGLERGLQGIAGIEGSGSSRLENSGSRQETSACVPYQYISDSRQRIEIYRKLAQLTEKAALPQLERELRDRFGPMPPPVELLLKVAELRILAGERAITAIEVREDKLMLTRNNDYLMIGSKFPRLTKKGAKVRLTEIKKLLLAL